MIVFDFARDAINKLNHNNRVPKIGREPWPNAKDCQLFKSRSTKILAAKILYKNGDYSTISNHSVE